MIKETIQDIRKAVLYQHKDLTKAVDTCKSDRFILNQNRINVRNILTNLKRLEDLFVFKNRVLPCRRREDKDIQILKDILVNQKF